MNSISQHETRSLEPVIQQTSSDGCWLMITKEGTFPNRTSFFRQTQPMHQCQRVLGAGLAGLFQTLGCFMSLPTRPSPGYGQQGKINWYSFLSSSAFPDEVLLSRWKDRRKAYHSWSENLGIELDNCLLYPFPRQKKAFGHSQSVLQCVPGKRSGVKKEKKNVVLSL